MFISKIKITLPIFLLMSVGCNGSGLQSSAKYDADNSGKNVRDEENLTVMPEDQLENDADLSLVQKIRQEVVADNSLSINAKNVKIVSVNGSVTLRGPVESLQERNAIGTKAKQIAGETKVDNQLEVKND